MVSGLTSISLIGRAPTLRVDAKPLVWRVPLALQRPCQALGCLASLGRPRSHGVWFTMNGLAERNLADAKYLRAKVQEALADPAPAPPLQKVFERLQQHHAERVTADAARKDKKA